MRRKPKLTLGRREKVDFPDLGLYNIDAKIDTGAYTSSLHCGDVKPVMKKGVPHVSFSLIDKRYEVFDKKKLVWPLHEQTTVKNSFGHKELRYVIKAKIIIYNTLYDIELTLADRSLMEFPVLLGRKLLKKNFMVDVSKINCSYSRKAVKKKI